jgi:hypothetical protein
MGQDITDSVKPYLSEDPTKWGKLASEVQWRRLQLLLLREILLELRKLNGQAPQQETGDENLLV